jgi:aspartyl protease family protein
MMIAGVARTAFFICLGAVLVAGFIADRLRGSGPSGMSMTQAPSAKANLVQPALGYGRVELRPDNAGHYTANVEVDGRSLPMLVDTGATLVALRYEDAVAIGRQPMPSDFTVAINTANGMTRVALIRLPEVRIATIRATDVQAFVLPQGATAQSLLGMSFLKKLGGFEIKAGSLVLQP